jgi:methionyl-tRNA synthetase
MQASLNGNSKSIVIENKILRAAKCEKCGAKMYPTSLLRPHLNRHQRRQHWFMTELRKLQYTMAHMRDIA